MRLLVIEDNDRLSEYVATALRRAGFAIDVATNGSDASAAIATTYYDTVILDLGLPDIDGLVWLKQMRRSNCKAPVLVLTAREALKDVVAGLNAGADDYLRKPFEVDELVARLRALLRRPGEALSAVLTEGDISFDTGSRALSVAGANVEIGRREASVLELLLRRSGRVVSKAAIEEAAYGHGEELSSNAIEVVIHRLRKRIVECGSEVSIHTLRGVGYILSVKPTSSECAKV
jgi:DNA-binding response OmpR family regulator